MYIVEIYHMDIISINKIDNDKTIKPNEDKSFVFVVALKRAVLMALQKAVLIIFFLSERKELTVSFISF